MVSDSTKAVCSSKLCCPLALFPYGPWAANFHLMSFPEQFHIVDGKIHRRIFLEDIVFLMGRREKDRNTFHNILEFKVKYIVEILDVSFLSIEIWTCFEDAYKLFSLSVLVLFYVIEIQIESMFTHLYKHRCLISSTAWDAKSTNLRRTDSLFSAASLALTSGIYRCIENF